MDKEHLLDNAEKYKGYARNCILVVNLLAIICFFSVFDLFHSIFMDEGYTRLIFTAFIFIYINVMFFSTLVILTLNSLTKGEKGKESVGE